MELGTGVFLSAVFLGTVGLFIATKDRWNWKKIFLWPLGIVVALSVVGGLFTYLSDKYENRPQKMAMVWGVSLGASKEDVKFSKGEPTEKTEDNWLYRHGIDNDRVYSVGFRDGKVRFVMYSGPTYDAPLIKGVAMYDTLQEIESVLGQASFVSKSKDELKRTYSFEKFNIAIEFEKGKILSIGIYDSAVSPLQYKGPSEQEKKIGAFLDDPDGSESKSMAQEQKQSNRNANEHRTKSGAASEREELEFLRRLAKEKVAAKSGERQ